MKIQEIFSVDAQASILNEVLASPYPYKIRQPDEEVLSASFETLAGVGYRYIMILSAQFFDDGSVAVKGDVRFSDEKGRIKLTGEGDAFKIMATVLEITRKLANNSAVIWQFLVNEIDEDTFDDMEEQGLIPKKIEILEFQAASEEPSRVRLYRRITKSVPGYNVFEPKTGEFFLIANTIMNKKQEII